MNGLVSLTFDDALEQHLDVAIPVLNEAKLVGTFYAHLTAPALSRRCAEWRAAALAGHELGNHTVFHPATAQKSWVQDGNAIEGYSLDRMRQELLVANQWLAALDDQDFRTFAYPCSNRMLGRSGWPCQLLRRIGLRQTRWPGLLERMGCDWGSTRVDYKPVVAELFPAARGGGLTLSGNVPAIESMDRWCLPSAAVESHSFADMSGFIKRAMADKTWAILQFHGVGGGHGMNCDASTFRDLVRWLEEHYADCVVSARDGADHIWGRTSAKRQSAAGSSNG